ncbi:MAG: hypothetical protein KDI17_19645, partial [Halioglobus sp.]|nr:hypothetical protein [Halioglobus sp.]
MSVGWEHHANELSAFLAGRSRLWLVSHKNPDGDGIGSAAALGLALRQRGFEVAISHPDPIPLRF